MIGKNEFPKVQELLDRAASTGRIPGSVVFIEHNGELSTYVAGVNDMKTKQPMKADQIFRITSMTKPVVAAATMKLVEEGTIKLSEPIATYLPEFTDTKVLKNTNSPLTETVPAKRPPTVEDLLTMLWGNGMLFFETDGKGTSYPIHLEMKKQGVTTAPPLPPVEITPDEYSRRLATLPLMHQPGERWMYNNASDVLGVLIARTTKTPLPDLLSQKVFKPLGMDDTGFFAPPEKASRFQPAYSIDFQTKEIRVSDPMDGSYSRPPIFPSGSAGLVSTAADYMKFAKMMLNEGTLGDTRLLKAETVREMLKDHVPQKVKDGSPFFPKFWDSTGWGYGLAIQTKADEITDKPGSYGWSGGFGTDWFNDPNYKLIGVVMTQLSVDFDFNTDVRKAVYDSLKSALHS